MTKIKNYKTTTPQQQVILSKSQNFIQTKLNDDNLNVEKSLKLVNNIFIKKNHNKTKFKLKWLKKFFKQTNQFYKKKTLLYLKRKLYYYHDSLFKKTVVVKVKANNVFCSLKDNLNKKIIFSCIASRYKIKITVKRLKYEISRILTFFYHDTKSKLNTRGLLVKIRSPKYLRSKIYKLCVRYFSRFKLKKIIQRRIVLYQIKDYKPFNGCRVNKKRRKKRRRSYNLKIK